MQTMAASEDIRVNYVRSLGMINDQIDPAMDDIVKNLSDITQCPIAMISLVESQRVWFKAAVGINVRQVRRSISFCSDAIASTSGIEILDASCHPRYKSNPLVTGITSLRFYSGIPVVPYHGHPVGALCVLDTNIRAPLTPRQKRQMKSLGRNLAALISSRMTGSLG